MSRIIFFLGIFIVIAVAWSISRRRQSLSIQERDELNELRRRERGRRNAQEAIGEPMEKCDECGVYFPRRDAIHENGRIYCSKRCRDAAARR